MIGGLYTHAAALALGMLIAGGTVWKAQENRYEHQLSAKDAQAAKKEADAKQKLLAATEAARKEEQALSAKYQGALNEARTREIALRRDVDSARSAADGLREQSAIAARRLAAAPPAAVVDYALAVGDLLAQCGREYQGLAEKADGHAGDVRAIIGAWPINPPPRP